MKLKRKIESIVIMIILALSISSCGTINKEPITRLGSKTSSFGSWKTPV